MPAHMHQRQLEWCAGYAGGWTAITQDLPIESCCAGQDGVLRSWSQHVIDRHGSYALHYIQTSCNCVCFATEHASCDECLHTCTRDSWSGVRDMRVDWPRNSGTQLHATKLKILDNSICICSDSDSDGTFPDWYCGDVGVIDAPLPKCVEIWKMMKKKFNASYRAFLNELACTTRQLIMIWYKLWHILVVHAISIQKVFFCGLLYGDRMPSVCMSFHHAQPNLKMGIA